MHQEEHKHCTQLPVIFKLNMPYVFYQVNLHELLRENKLEIMIDRSIRKTQPNSIIYLNSIPIR